MYGLSKYRYYKEIPLGNVGKGLFNLKSNEFFINIPLINTIGEDSFSLNLFYVSNKLSTKVSFLKGLFCPLERSFVVNSISVSPVLASCNLQVKTFDGLNKTIRGNSISDDEKILYYYFYEYKDYLEYNAYVSPKIDDKRFYPIDEQYISMYDKTSGNVYYYKKNSTWPYYIVLNNKQVIRFIRNGNDIVIKKCKYHTETKNIDNKNEEVIILDEMNSYEITLSKEQNDYFSKITYKKNNTLLSYVTLSSDDDNDIKMNYYLGDCVKEITINQTYYQDRVEYNFTDVYKNIVYKLKTTFAGQLTEYTKTINNKMCDKITFEYSDGYIYTLDYKGRRELICYNEEGALKTYIDKFGYAVNYEYINDGVVNDFNNLLVKEISRPLYIRNDSNSILKGGFFASGSMSAFEYENCSIYAGGYFPYQFVGSFGVKINADGYIMSNQESIFLKDKQYTISFWAKGQGELDVNYGSNYEEITLTDNPTFYTYYYESNSNSSYFRMKNYSSNDAYVTGITVYEFDSQVKYSYSYDGRIVEVIDDKKHDYSYMDVNGGLVVCNDTDGFSKKKYTTDGLLDEVEYSNNHKVKYFYDENKRVNKTWNYIDKGNGTYITNARDYNNDLVSRESFHRYLEHNSSQAVVDYSIINEYNNNYTLKSVTNSYCINDVHYPGFKEEYEYNTKRQLAKYKVLSSQNEIGYLNDEVNSLKQLDMDYQMTYNDCEQLTRVSLLSNNQSYDLCEYEYYYENSVYTNKLKKKIFGN